MEKLKELMKSRKRLIISAVLLVAMIALVACGKDGKSGGGQKETESAAGDSNAAMTTYTVSLKTQGGMAMSEIDVYVYADDTLADLKGFKATDENGIATFELPASENYAIALTGVPKGYNVAASYGFTGDTAVIGLTSSVITGEDISGVQLGLGDVMYDMTVKTSDGQEITISELLKEKKMVMLNFWYTTCQYCVEEFPYMQEAYEKYKDDIEIIALNHLNDDNAINAFKSQMGLTFPTAT